MSTPLRTDASAERSEKICEFARAKMSAGIYEAAFALFAQSLQSFPSLESALNGLLECGPKLTDHAAASMTIKSLRKDFAQVGGITGDFLDSLVLTAVQPARKDFALSACDRAFRIGVPIAGRTLAERALALLSNADKQTADDYSALAKSAFDNRLYELAECAGQTAVDLDPGNSERRSFHKNATAARIIEERKLEKPETRFIDNLADPSGQQNLQERPISSADELEQLISFARDEFNQRKDEKGKISKLVSLLEKRGQPGDIDEASTILTGAFERSHDSSFRQRLADLQIRPLENAMKAAQRAQSLNPEQAQLRQDLIEKRKVYLVARCTEFEKRAIEYPTEPTIRLELGEMLLSLNRCNEAIPHLQAGRADMKQRSRAWRLLGQAFMAIAYWDEAAWCLEEAFKYVDNDSHRQLDAKLSLGRALLELYSKKPDNTYLDRARRIIMEVVVEDFTHPGATKLRAMLSRITADEQPK